MFTNNKKYILASSSRSRFKILTKCGFDFKKVKPLCDEDKIKKNIDMKKTKPINIVKKLAFEKSKSVSILKKYFKFRLNHYLKINVKFIGQTAKVKVIKSSQHQFENVELHN